MAADDEMESRVDRVADELLIPLNHGHLLGDTDRWSIQRVCLLLMEDICISSRQFIHSFIPTSAIQ